MFGWLGPITIRTKRGTRVTVFLGGVVLSLPLVLYRRRATSPAETSSEGSREVGVDLSDR